MTEKISWEEFADSGFLWLVNSILHLFGLAIGLEYEDNELIGVYPMKCKFRGFNEKSNDKGYYDVTKYMTENAKQLLRDCEYPETSDSQIPTFHL